MSKVNDKCEHCDNITKRWIECDSCGKREPQPYSNVFPAGWYVVEVYERVNRHPDESKSYEHELEEILSKDACSKKCLEKVLASAFGEVSK